MKLKPAILALAAASLGTTPLHAVDLFWDADAASTAATGGTGNWETSTSLWRNGSATGTLQAWPITGGNNDAILGGTAGTLTLTTGISVNDLSVDPTSGTSYIVTGATQTLTLGGTTSPVIDVATGDSLTITSRLAGTQGFTKSSAGTLILDTPQGTGGLIGGITVSGGTLQAGSATNNSASQVLRSNAVTLAAGTSLTTVGTTTELRVGSLSGSGSVTPATGGAINELALSDSTFSGAITTTGGLNLRGGNGTTQTFNGDLTALTGTIGINSGATLRLSGNSTSGVLGSLALAPRGGTIVLDNTAGNTSAGTGRIRDTATVTFLGGTVSLIGNTAGTSETLGAPTFNEGSNVISVTNNGGTGAQLTLTDSGSLRDTNQMTINFVGAGTGTIGSAGNNPRITFSGTPTTITSGTSAPLGMFANTATGATVGWATVNGTEWAGYGPNGVIALTPNATPTAAANLGALNATSMAVFSPTGLVTASGAVTVGALKITPNGGTTLALGSNNLTTSALMLAGATDFNITGAGALNGPATKYIYVTDANTTLSIAGNLLGSSQPIIKSGPGFLNANGSSTQLTATGNTGVILLDGVFRGTLTTLGGGTSAGGANTTIGFRGGVLEINGGGTFSRAIDVNGNSSGGGVSFDGSTAGRGDGGFSAINGNANVTLVTTNGGATAASLVWNNGAFLSNGYALKMGSTKSDSRIDITNNVGLDDGTASNSYFGREIRVADNTSSTTDIARLSGVVSGSTNTDLLKTGAGVLELTNANTYDGSTLVQQGTLLINGIQSSANGIVSVASGATLGGSGTHGGNISITNGAILAPGNSPGVLTTTGTTTLDTDSIFSWELNANLDGDTVDVGDTGARGTNYDGLTSANLTVANGAIFRVVLTGTADIASTFWDQTQIWNDILSVSGTTSNAAVGHLFNAFEVYNGTTNFTLAAASEGSFSFTGSTLTWTAVPEPSSALAGLLIAAGLLRRRRVA